MQQDFIKNNNKQFKQLTFAITKRQEPALVVINIANENAKKYVKQEIEKQFPNYTNYDIELTGVNFGSLTNHLLRNLPESVTKSKTIKDVIHITGLKNHALEIKNDDNNELIFEASEVIKQINFERSRIFKEIPAILILYIDNYTYRKLLEAASDFLDWVNYYFKFESNETESYTEEYKEEINYKPEPHYTPERKIKIKDLKQKLEKLDSNKLPEQRFFRTQINLQFALARELSEVREFEKSNKHLQNALNTINKYKISEELKAELTFYTATNYLDLIKFEKAIENYYSVITILEKTNNLSQIGSSYHQIGIVYQLQRDWNKSLENYKKAISWNEKTNNLSKIGGSYHQIGMVYQLQRDWNKSLENYKKAISWDEKTNNLSQIGSSYHQIGMVYEDQRDWNKSLENYKKAISWNEKTNNLSQIGSSYHQIGRLYELQRDWNKSLENYKKAISWNEKTNNLSQIGGSYHQIGMVYEEQRDWNKSLENYKKAISWDEKTNNLSQVGSSYHQIGRVYQLQRDWNKSLENYKKAISWDEKTNNLSQIGSSYHQIGMVYGDQRDWNKSLENYKKAISWDEKTNNLSQIGGSYHQIGRVYQEQEIFNDAIAYFKMSLQNSLKYKVFIHEWTLENIKKVLQKINNTKITEEVNELIKQTEKYIIKE